MEKSRGRRAPGMSLDKWLAGSLFVRGWRAPPHRKRLTSNPLTPQYALLGDQGGLGGVHVPRFQARCLGDRHLPRLTCPRIRLALVRLSPLSRDPGQLDRPSRDRRQASISSQGTSEAPFTRSSGGAVALVLAGSGFVLEAFQQELTSPPRLSGRKSSESGYSPRYRFGAGRGSEALRRRPSGPRPRRAGRHRDWAYRRAKRDLEIRAAVTRWPAQSLVARPQHRCVPPSPSHRTALGWTMSTEMNRTLPRATENSCLTNSADAQPRKMRIALSTW